MEIKGLINQEELLTLLSDLISIKSVNPEYDQESSERETADYIRNFLQRYKIACEMQEVFPGRCNVVGKLDGADREKCLLFEAHMDTVSTKGMSIDPFRPEIKGDLIYGRGACDTKAGFAAMLYALKLVHELEVQPSASVLLAATVDEEYLFRGVRHLIRSGIKASGAIVSEPTELSVVIAHKGCLRWRIITRGKAAHSSKAHLGINAILKMMKIIQAIEAKLIPMYERKQHPLVGCPTVNIGKIQGGVQVNIVPDSCMIEIDRRVIPGETTESVWNEFAQLLYELKATDPAFEAIMEEPMLEDFPLETQERERVVTIAREACHRVLGNAIICGVPYGTDASKLSRAGIPSIVLGPGSIDQAHTAAEYVHIDQVLKATEIYAQIMLKF